MPPTLFFYHLLFKLQPWRRHPSKQTNSRCWESDPRCCPTQSKRYISLLFTLMRLWGHRLLTTHATALFSSAGVDVIDMRRSLMNACVHVASMMDHLTANPTPLLYSPFPALFRPAVEDAVSRGTKLSSAPSPCQPRSYGVTTYPACTSGNLPQHGQSCSLP